jgi:hypothetical protein
MKTHAIVCFLFTGIVLQSTLAQRDRFSQKGVQVGETMPSLTLYTADSKKVELDATWKTKPALIVTGSLTCPIARRKCPLLENTLAGLDGKINVVVVYTIEAHPEGDPSPNAGKTETPMINLRSGIVYGQPKTLSKRMELMKEFVERTGIEYSVLVDDMENHAWKAFGNGPNLALLVDSSGKVIAKQGWLDPDTIRHEINKLITTD